MADDMNSCIEPSKGPIGVSETTETESLEVRKAEEESMVLAKVGKPAPDFEATAYIDSGFKKIKLSDYKGQWVVVCFYPGDFTFV